MKRFLRASVLTIGAVLTISIAVVIQPSPGALAQAQVPAASPSPTPKPAASPAASPAAATAPAPRAGGFPMELAWPLLAGGAAAVGAGAVLLRRGRR